MEPDDLERLFHEARIDDQRRVPAFAAVLARGPRKHATPRLRLAFALGLVAIGAIGVWRLVTPNEPKLVIALVPGDMRVPTDYLLDMVQFPRAGEIPRLGAADWFPLPAASDAAIDTRRLP